MNEWFSSARGHQQVLSTQKGRQQAAMKGWQFYEAKL